MNRRGVITIEAAVVMPLVIVTILGFMYFMKIIYIQNEVHSAMTRAGHELVAYTTPLKELGVVDAQHSVMNAGEAQVEATSASLSELMANGQNIIDNTTTITDFAIDYDTMSIKMPTLESPSDFGSMMKEGYELIKTMPEVLDGYNDNLTSFIGQVGDLIYQAKSGIGDVVLAEVLDYANGLATREVAKFGVEKYLSLEQMEAYGIHNDYDLMYPIDFGDSNLMLYDDSLELVARYTIDAPLLSGVFDGVPIYQSLSVRAFTGSYDYETSEIKPPVIVKQKVGEETDYYISLKVSQPPYHEYTCLRPNVSDGELQTLVQSKKVCQYCSDHFTPVENICYFTKSGSVIHYSKTCPKMYSSTIRALTVEEYESGDYRPCGNCNPD